MGNTLYCDLDHVLADFDARARMLLQTDNTYRWEFTHGPKAFWEVLDADPAFFENLPPMPDAFDLWKAIEHRAPVILTALPKTGAAAVDRQKRTWVSKHLGPDVQVITCQTPEKPNYCTPGDVLIDDRTLNRDLWVRRGGNFVFHTTAASSIEQLLILQEI